MGGSVKDVQSKSFCISPSTSPHAVFLRVEAEEQPEISEAYSVSSVPYFVFFKDGNKVDTLEGADPSSLANKVSKVAGVVYPWDPAAPASLGMAAGPAVLESVKELAADNGSSKVADHSLSSAVDYLNQSQKVVDILTNEKVKFGSFDILSDSEVREGLKKLSNWPTYPQLYCKGELLGGCDIVIAMHESGELQEVFEGHGIGTASSGDTNVNGSKSGEGVISEASGLSEKLTSRLCTLINSSPVMLFMKGKPEEPKCGFSRKVVDILNQEKVTFGSFDILSDDEILFWKCKRVESSRKCWQKMESSARSLLRSASRSFVSSSPVMLFMKGTPDGPRCGFSSKVVKALKEEGVEFGSFDILSDEEVRQGLKTFSNWPTFPQLYYKGELIGGCDIIMELHSSGDLKATLSE
ncbi:unnamed protein product [Rhodiola kirilowii]